MEEIRIIITTIISTVVGLGGVGFLSYIFFFRSKKKKEKADADKATHSSESVAIENIQKVLREWIEVSNRYKKDYDTLFENQEKLLAQNTEIKEQNNQFERELHDVNNSFRELVNLLSTNCLECEYVSDKMKSRIKAKLK